MHINKHFDWKFYVDYHKDLQSANINTQEKAINHWLKYGRKSGRIYNEHAIDFDWIFYLSHYPDLKKKGINTQEKALLHWLEYGIKEDRICNKKYLNNNLSNKFIFELYIRELTDDTIDTYDKAYRHFTTIGNSSYTNKIKLLDKLNITDTNYYYELYDFIKDYKDYGFDNLNINQIFDVINNNPKMEYRYFCYRYRNYMRNFLIQDLPINSNKEAVLIEFRKFPHLEFLIRNAIIKLGYEWSHTIICGEDNYDFILNMCSTISDKIRIIKYPYKNLSVNQYSLLLASKEFWENLSGEKILIYQDDSCIFKSNINDFLDFDYIGAPWPKHQNDNDLLVGNGGFSLRSRSIMLKVIETISITNTKYNSSTLAYMESCKIQILPEDVYFSKNIIDYKLGKVADYDIANKFSVETQYHDDPFGGHNFYISIKNWKKHMYKYVCIQLCPPDNLINMLSFYTHRGGWKWILCNMLKNDIYNKSSDINLIDLIEFYTFANEKNGNNMYPYFNNTNNKYIGLIHGTILGRFKEDPCCLTNVLDFKSKFISNIDKFIMIFTFSKYVKNYIENIFKENNISVPVYNLYHPTSFNTFNNFSIDLFISNKDKKIIQLGQQLRYHTAIYLINTNYTKIWLPGFNNKIQAHQFVKHELWERNIQDKINFDDVQILYLDNYQEYDKLLENNIVLLYIKDANANNAVIECIIRNTPFIINRHPAIIEYLGESYPLYFNEISEINDLLTDDNIIQAYIYLCKLDKSKLNIKSFINNLLYHISITKNIESASVHLVNTNDNHF